MLDYIDAISSESARFNELSRATDPAAPVPSCPGWSASDLFWHLTEVQYFWATIVEDLLMDPDAVDHLTRPDDFQLPNVFEFQSRRLQHTLRQRNATDECWSWHDAGNNVGWVRRRQVHEALIHRVDAELAAGHLPIVDEALAADGVDEVLAVYLDAGDLPGWATFLPDGSSVRIAIDGGRSWSVVLGRFRGTSPNSGKSYDEPALRLEDVAQPSTLVAGRASDLDLWLWGRGPLDPLRVSGDKTAVARVRAAAAAATQ